MVRQDLGAMTTMLKTACQNSKYFGFYDFSKMAILGPCLQYLQGLLLLLLLTKQFPRFFSYFHLSQGHEIWYTHSSSNYLGGILKFFENSNFFFFIFSFGTQPFRVAIGTFPMPWQGMCGMGHGLHTRATLPTVNHRVYHAIPL